jgi:AmmeMemoRadiSam system protein A
MDPEPLSPVERQQLLRLARLAVQAAAERREPPPIERGEYSARLFEPGAVFVTLTDRDGDLRGCIGALEAYQPLVEDVREHAAAAATQDFRFLPVAPEEVRGLNIEISRLTSPQPLEYGAPEELAVRLRPGVDGLILRDGPRRATFLPQVWEKVGDPEEFLGHLCLKMGGPANLWRKKKLDALTYQVEEFHE